MKTNGGKCNKCWALTNKNNVCYSDGLPTIPRQDEIKKNEHRSEAGR